MEESGLQSSINADDKGAEIIKTDASLWSTITYFILLCYTPVRIIASVSCLFVFGVYFAQLLALVTSYVFAVEITSLLLFALISFLEFTSIVRRRPSLRLSLLCFLFSLLNIFFVCDLLVFSISCILNNCGDGLCSCGISGGWAVHSWQLVALTCMNIAVLIFEVIGVIVSANSIIAAMFEAGRETVVIVRSPERLQLIIRGLVGGQIIALVWYIQCVVGCAWFWAQTIAVVITKGLDHDFGVSDFLHGSFLIISLFTFAYAPPPAVTLGTSFKTLLSGQLISILGRMLLPTGAFLLSGYIASFDLIYAYVDRPGKPEYAVRLGYMGYTTIVIAAVLSSWYIVSSLILYVFLGLLAAFSRPVVGLILNLIDKIVKVPEDVRKALTEGGNERSELEVNAEHIGTLQKRLLGVLDFASVNDVMYVPAAYCLNRMTGVLICVYSTQLILSILPVIPYIFICIGLDIFDRHFEIVFIPMAVFLVSVIISLYGIKGVFTCSPKDVFLVCVPSNLVILILLLLTVELRILVCVATTPMFEDSYCNWYNFLRYDDSGSQGAYLLMPYAELLVSAATLLSATMGILLGIVAPVLGLILMMYVEAVDDLTIRSLIPRIPFLGHKGSKMAKEKRETADVEEDFIVSHEESVPTDLQLSERDDEIDDVREDEGRNGETAEEDIDDPIDIVIF